MQVSVGPRLKVARLPSAGDATVRNIMNSRPHRLLAASVIAEIAACLVAATSRCGF